MVQLKRMVEQLTLENERLHKKACNKEALDELAFYRNQQSDEQRLKNELLRNQEEKEKVCFTV